MNSSGLLARIETSKSLPTLPHILLKLIEACHRKEKGIRDLARIINQDPSLSERVLRLVNSAYYSLKQKVSSIDQALLLLGMDAVKNIAISSSIYQVFNRPQAKNGINLKLFWWHSFSCAVAARLLALKTQYPTPDEAFLSGLLHDIGKIVLWTNFTEDYDRILKTAAGSSADLLAAEAKMGLTHPEAGAWLIGRWDLRSFMPDAVRYHHESEERVRSSFPLVRLVFAANSLCPSYPGVEPQYEMSSRVLGLSARELEAVRLEGEAEVRDIARTLEIEIEPPGVGAPAFSPVDQKKLDDLARLIRDYSLLQSLGEGFVKAAGWQAVLDNSRQGLLLLFDLARALFFRLEGASLIGEQNADGGRLVIPFAEQSGLLARSLLQGEIVDSFSAAPSGQVSLFDEQLARFLGADGILCLPLRAEGEPLGVLVAGIRSSDRANLVARRSLLGLLANQASLALYAQRVRDRQAERIREERLAASSLLARRIVHEAHNPLGIINNYLSILSAKLLDNAALQDDLRIIREEIRRVSQIISELASFAAPAAAPKEPVDLNALISDLVKISQESMWELSKVRIQLALDPEVPPIRSEKNKLKQVLINLLKNGAEAMPSGGDLQVESRLRPGEPVRIEILVRDQGPGIPEEVRASLFEPFVGTKGREGLGLAIVYGILKELGGAIDYQTGSGGTTFRVELPVQ